MRADAHAVAPHGIHCTRAAPGGVRLPTSIHSKASPAEALFAHGLGGYKPPRKDGARLRVPCCLAPATATSMAPSKLCWRAQARRTRHTLSTRRAHPICRHCHQSAGNDASPHLNSTKAAVPCFPPPDRRRDGHCADALSPSLLKHRLKAEGAQQNGRTLAVGEI